MSDSWEYVEDGYVEDGYVFTGRPVIFQYGSNRIELRCPSRRSGSVRLLQAEEYSTGWSRYGFAPIAVLHTLELDYRRMSTEEYQALEAFQAAVDYSATEFDFIEGLTGVVIKARFFEPSQAIEEASYGLYRGRIVLMSLVPFIAYPASPPANINAILATAHYPFQFTVSRKQPRGWMSDGTLRIVNKSACKRRFHTLSLVRRTVVELGEVLSFFQNTAVGIQNKWSWYWNGVIRLARFSETVLSWQQSQVRSDRFDVAVTLEEEEEWSPLHLFSSGIQGLWLDPSDLASMFQDAAGITPVTAAGQPVGLIRDKSGRGNHLVQTTSSAKPILRQDTGGLYYLEPDGIDDLLSVTLAIAPGNCTLVMAGPGECTVLWPLNVGTTFELHSGPCYGLVLIARQLLEGVDL